jgi:hypothetical protein
MLNTEHAYIEAGYKCGKAARHQDAALARHWRQWLARAIDLENEHADKLHAAHLFRQGYSEANPPRTVEYFR